MKTYGYILIALSIAYLVYMFWQPKWGVNRKYKSGSRWAFWRWTITDSDYIRRLHIFMCPWFAICLHFIRKPDVEPHMHDHPVTFLSLVLKGWYREERTKVIEGWFALACDGVRRWYNFIRATRNDHHRIVEVSPGGCVTLAFMTKVKQKWGFHTEDGWIYYKDYYAQPVLVNVSGIIITMQRKDFYQSVEKGLLRYDEEIKHPAQSFLPPPEDYFKYEIGN